MDSSERREHWIFKQTAKKSYSEPFSYSYVMEDGKLPFLAEHHPVRVPSISAPKTQDSRFQIPIARRKSLRKRENAERHSAPVECTSPPATPSKSEMLKRALSLSSMRSSHGNRSIQSRSNSVRSISPGTNLPTIPQVPWMAGDSNSSATMVTGLTPATLTLTLPTPSPSPVPSLKSFESRPSTPMSIASSYMSADDRLELLNLQRAAMGRLSPRPAMYVGGRKDKALATLGITSPPYTPPFTPPASTVPSKAPSLRDPNGGPMRKNSIQVSTQISTTTTPRSSVIENSKVPVEQPQTTIVHPRPILRRKTSKFIEHLDSQPKPTPEAASEPASEAEPESKRDSMEITTVERVRFEMLQPAPIQLQTTSTRPGVGIRRSQSMRTPSTIPGRWSGIVCTAEARSVVAAGSAKLVSF